MLKSILQKFGCVIVIISLIISFAYWDFADAGIPQQLYFQARLTTTTGSSVSGAQSVTFRIYASSSGGTAEWTETQSVTADEFGIISCYLGSVAAFPDSMSFNEAYYISIQVGSDAEMSPRIKIVPSMNSLNAPRFSGMNATQFLRADVAANATAPFQVSGNTTGTSFKVTQSGNGDIFQLYNGTTNVATMTRAGNFGIGTATPAQKLEVAGTVKATSFEGDGSGLSGVNSISGLATSYLTKATSSTSLGGSLIYDNGANIGIGTSTPLQKLHIQNGAIYMNANVPADPASSLYNNGGNLYWSGVALSTGTSVSGNQYYIPVFTGVSSLSDSGIFETSGKDIGIGKTNPATKLDVNGVITATGGNSGRGKSVFISFKFE
jgi:hypothetical protein